MLNAKKTFMNLLENNYAQQHFKLHRKKNNIVYIYIYVYDDYTYILCMCFLSCTI